MDREPTRQLLIARHRYASTIADHPVKIVAKRRLLDDFLSVDEAILDIGGGANQRRLSLERGDAAAAIVRRLPDGEILLTRQFRYPTLDKGPGWVLEVPAGVVENDESPVGTIERELVEELGYEAAHIEPIAAFYVSPGGSSERVFLYYAEVSESGRVSDGGGLAAEGEDITIEAYTLDELVARMDSGDIVDAKTLIGIQWLVIRDRG